MSADSPSADRARGEICDGCLDGLPKVFLGLLALETATAEVDRREPLDVGGLHEAAEVLEACEGRAAPDAALQGGDVELRALRGGEELPTTLVACRHQLAEERALLQVALVLRADAHLRPERGSAAPRPYVEASATDV